MTSERLEPHGRQDSADPGLEAGLDRATFIRRAGAAGAALAAIAAGGPLAGSALGSSRARADRPLVPRHRIGIGLEEYAFSQQPPADVYAKLGEIRDIGYRATELIEFNGFAGGVERARQVRRLLQRAGVRAVGNFHLTYATPQNLRNALDTFVEEDRAAGMINMGMVAAEHDPEWQTEERYRELARDFNRWGAITKRAGMKFYLHDEAWVFDRDPVTGKVLFDVWIEETDPELVFFCFDVMWPAYRGLDPVDYLRRLERDDRITHFHIKDWNGQQAAPGAATSSTQTDVGAGVIDFPRFFRAIERPEKYWYIVEREASPDPTQTAQRSYDYLAGLTA
jgi:sugar phosphate isomerase/epimerase